MRVRWSLIFAIVFFAAVSPSSWDTYNTINQRAFLDLFLKGNPYHYALETVVRFAGETWKLDWPYPPLTIVFNVAAWMVYRFIGSEPLYQFLFKLPLFLSAVVVFFLLERIEHELRVSKAHVRWADLYILNPTVLLLASIAGGFEVVMTLFLVWSCVLYRQSRFVASGFMIGLAIALRLYPIVTVPIFLLDARKRSSRSGFTTFIIASLTPLVLTVVPFVLTDWGSFLQVLGSRQLAIGPFATVNAAAPVVLYTVEAVGRQIFDYNAALGAVTLVSMVLGMVGMSMVYLFCAHHFASVEEGLLLSLLVFFAFYPKVHGLYTIAILPLALMTGMRYAQWVWVPGAAWMLLFNGAFGAAGILYFFAPISGIWVPILPAGLFVPGTMILAGMQFLLIVAATGQALRDITKRTIYMQTVAV